MKILIIKPSGLGDIVQALPVLTGLKRRWPEAEIDWIVNDSFREILEGHPCLRKTILYPRKPLDLAQADPGNLALGQVGCARRSTTSRSTCRAFSAARTDDLGRQQPPTGSDLDLRPRGLASAAYNEFVADTAISAAERYLTCLEHLDIPVVAARFPAHRPRTAAGGADKRFRSLHRPASLFALADQALAVALLPGVWSIRCPRPNSSSWEIGPWFPLEAPGRLIDLRGKLAIGTLVTVLDRAQSGSSAPIRVRPTSPEPWADPVLVLFGATDWRKTKPSGSNVLIHTHALFCSPCPKTELLAGYPGGVHESPNPAKD